MFRLAIDGDENEFSGTLSCSDGGCANFSYKRNSSGFDVSISAVNFTTSDDFFDAMMRLRLLIDKEYEASIQ